MAMAEKDHKEIVRGIEHWPGKWRMEATFWGTQVPLKFRKLVGSKVYPRTYRKKNAAPTIPWF